MPQLEFHSRSEWRRWLQRNHSREREVWLVFHKRSSGDAGISYEDAIEEALCFGWVDSLVKKLDEKRYLRKFTPRKPDSRWSTINRRRYASLQKRGLLAAPGRARAPTNRSGDAPRPSPTNLAKDIEIHLKSNAKAWTFFQNLAPSYRRLYIAWIEAAKRPETRAKRIGEAIRMLASGQKLGLK